MLNKGIQWLSVCSLLFALAWAAAAGAADVRTQGPEADDEVSVEVVVDGAVLFRVRGTSAFPAEKRAQLVAERIVALAADPGFKREDLRIDESQPGVAQVMAGNTRMMAIHAADAELEGVDARTLATTVVHRVGEAVEVWRHDRLPATLVRTGFTRSARRLPLGWGSGWERCSCAVGAGSPSSASAPASTTSRCSASGSSVRDRCGRCSPAC